MEPVTEKLRNSQKRKPKNDINSICIREIAYFFREDVKFMEIIRDRLLMKFWWNLEIFRIYIKP